MLLSLFSPGRNFYRLSDIGATSLSLSLYFSVSISSLFPFNSMVVILGAFLKFPRLRNAVSCVEHIPAVRDERTYI